MTITQTLADLGLTMETAFVPFSQSRNKAEKSPSLNWRMTIKRNGKEVLTTDYSAGSGHCPAGQATQPPVGWQGDLKQWKRYAVARECERGFAAKVQGFGAPILPEFADAMCSLSADSSVLNHDGFESWASEFGYETDSRKAESIYRHCLDIALKLRSAIGETGLATLAEAFQDY